MMQNSETADCLDCFEDPRYSFMFQNNHSILKVSVLDYNASHH